MDDRTPYTGLLVALRAWAREGEGVLARAMEHYGERSPTEAAEVGEHLAGLTAARWRALDVLIGQRLAAERARLAAAVAETAAAERRTEEETERRFRAREQERRRFRHDDDRLRRLDEADERDGERCEAAQVASEAARAALDAFDAAVREQEGGRGSDD